MTKATRLLTLAALLLATAFAQAGNWPRFRGPNGTGTVDDGDVPLTFSEKENLLWEVAIPGVGHSSPVVWGESLSLQSASKDGKDRWLICVDTGDGSIRYGEIVTVIDAAKGAGIEKVGIVTDGMRKGPSGAPTGGSQ